MGRFENKRVLVTGAAAGIGRAVARAFAAEGAHVMLADRNGAGVSALAAELGATARAFTYDALLSGDGARMVAEACEDGLDILCNIAGIYDRNHFGQTSDGDIARIIQINLTSPIEICRAAIPALLKTRGVILNTSSASAVKGIAYAAPYAASKAGINLLTKSLAVEFAHEGLRVNAVAPGRVLTEIGTALQPMADARPELALHRAKLRDMTEGVPPEEIATSYLWLASAEARFVTGEIMVIDGAYTVG